MSDRPPIPVTCAHRPTIGGVVVPYVNVALADGGIDFRSQHTTKAQECWVETRCQICGHKITRPPIVFLGGPNQVEALRFDEPPLHPECAAYASKACPMVAGRQEEYASRPTVSAGPRGGTCPIPGCRCGGWMATPGSNGTHGGGPAHPWYAVYVDHYAVGVTKQHPDLVVVGVVEPEHVLAIRHVSTPGVGRIWKRIERTAPQ